MISIIIPIYNEEAVLFKNFVDLQRLSRVAELIFVDGGSVDQGHCIARQCGRLFYSSKGRAVQMNYGASRAKNGILLFLHADNIIFPDTPASIEKVIEGGCVGGCLTQKIDNQASIFRLIEWQGNFRAGISKEFYGDQGIFVTKDIFSKINGFPQVTIMEDLIFSGKLRRSGRVSVLPDKIQVSARRWEKNGIIMTTLLFNLIILLFWLKVPLNKIKHLYEDLR